MWKPPTSSCSASTRSNGGRLSSAVAAMTKTTNGTTPVAMRFQFRTVVLRDDDAVGGQRARHEHHGGHRQAERGLVADHLRRGPHRAEQRVLRARRPAGQHDAVDRDRAHGQHEQDADRRVGHLQVASRGRRCVDDAVVAVGEVAADRDDGEDEERGHERRYGASRNTKRIGPLRVDRSSLKNDLMPSARVCRMPNGPALFGPDAVLHPGDDLALEPDHEHGGDEQEDEADDHLEDGDADDRPASMSPW